MKGLFGHLAGAGARAPAPRNNAALDGGVVIQTSSQLEEALRSGSVSASGEVVNSETAMRVAAVFACVRLRAGVPANMPLDIMRRVDARSRVEADDHPVSRLLKQRPNPWQKPAQFRRMMGAAVQLRGEAHAMKVVSRGEVIALLPLHPDRTTTTQLDDLSVVVDYVRKDGRTVRLPQNEVFSLIGLSLDGIHGLSPIAYARETIGLSLAMERHGASTFRNGARVSGALKHPGKLGDAAIDNLRASLEAFRNGGDREGKELILEEGMDYTPLGMNAKDAEWIEGRRFSRADIYMLYGIPPHMAGDTEKTTSFGAGIDSQTQGFVAFTAEDDLITWEEAVNVDLLNGDPALYARFNRASLVRGDIKTRWEAHVKALQWGVSSPNEIRAIEDQNPREGGDIYYPPPNTAGGKSQTGEPDEPAKTA